MWIADFLKCLNKKKYLLLLDVYGTEVCALMNEKHSTLCLPLVWCYLFIVFPFQTLIYAFYYVQPKVPLPVELRLDVIKKKNF